MNTSLSYDKLYLIRHEKARGNSNKSLRFQGFIGSMDGFFRARKRNASKGPHAGPQRHFTDCSTSKRAQNAIRSISAFIENRGLNDRMRTQSRRLVDPDTLEQ
jgi:hypothetical protein